VTAVSLHRDGQWEGRGMTRAVEGSDNNSLSLPAHAYPLGLTLWLTLAQAGPAVPGGAGPYRLAARGRAVRGNPAARDSALLCFSTSTEPIQPTIQPLDVGWSSQPQSVPHPVTTRLGLFTGQTESGSSSHLISRYCSHWEWAADCERLWVSRLGLGEKGLWVFALNGHGYNLRKAWT